MKRMIFSLFVFVSILGFYHLVSADVIYSQPYIGQSIIPRTYFVGGVSGINQQTDDYIFNTFTIPENFTSIRIKRLSGRPCAYITNLSIRGSINTVVFDDSISTSEDYCDYEVSESSAGLAGVYKDITFMYGSEYPDSTNPVDTYLDGSSYNDGGSIRIDNYNPPNTTYTLFDGGWAFIIYNVNLDINPNYPNVSNEFLASPSSASCTDGIKNQDETEIDSGGVCASYEYSSRITTGSTFSNGTTNVIAMNGNAPVGIDSICFSLDKDEYSSTNVGWNIGVENGWTYMGKDIGQWFWELNNSSEWSTSHPIFGVNMGAVAEDYGSNAHFSSDYAVGQIRGNQSYPYVGYINFFDNYDCTGKVFGYVTYTVKGLHDFVLGTTITKDVPEPVIGCMDSNANNYNSEATEDTVPSSCLDNGNRVGNVSQLISDTLSQQIYNSTGMYQSLGNGINGILTEIDLYVLTTYPVYYGNFIGADIYESDDNVLNVNEDDIIWEQTADNKVTVNNFNGKVVLNNPNDIDNLTYSFKENKFYFLYLINGTSDGGGLYNGIYFYGNTDEDSFVSGHFYNDNHIKDLQFNLLGLSFGDIEEATCSDGIRNQDETDIDIGGVCQKLTHNPVLIIPGVLGTEISKPDNIFEKLWLNVVRNIADIGDQFMDPLQFNADLTPSDASLRIDDVIGKINFNLGILGDRTFDYSHGLIEEFQYQGYVEDIDIFLFPYDWRYGVSESNIDKLKQKIEEIRVQTGSDKVDVIAHSTGGLLIKKYVMDNQEDNHVGKAIFVGVPNTGAPQAVKTLLQGSNFNVPLLADEEMKKIAKNMPVIYDLSPSEEYYNSKGSYIKILDQYGSLAKVKDLNFNEANSFLIDDHDFNSQALSNAHNLHTADFDNFDMRNSITSLYSINGCKAGTTRGIIESRSKDAFGNISLSYDLLRPTTGDGTVPLESSTNLIIDQSNKYYSLINDHSKMLSADGTRQEIVNLISGSTLSTKDTSGNDLITQDDSNCELDGDFLEMKSPVDIDITDQDGNHAGLVSGAIENNIPNASFEIMGEHKFVYLPDDEGQTYTINLKGTGNGTFTLSNEDISGDDITQTEVFSNIPVTTSLTGQVNLSGGITTLSLDNNGDGTTDQTIQPSSVVDSDQSQDLISPISTPIITGPEGQSGFYRGDVSIDISVFDPVITGQELETSGILKTNYNLDDVGYQTYSAPINISTEGQHTIKFFSTDKSGNNEIEQSISFIIDKTSPELQMTFDINDKDVIFSAQDNLDQNPTILTTRNSTTLTDASGNITIIKYKEFPTDFKFTHNKKIKNNVIISFPINRYKELTTKLWFTFTQITRNGITTKVPNNSVFYDWQEKKGKLTDLETKITIKGVDKYVFNYKKATNTTIIRVRTNSNVVTTTRKGFVVVTIKTKGDSLEVGY